MPVRVTVCGRLVGIVGRGGEKYLAHWLLVYGIMTLVLVLPGWGFNVPGITHVIGVLGSGEASGRMGGHVF